MSITSAHTDYIGGTYEALIWGKNSSRQYILLALSSSGKYELYKKQIGINGSSLCRGTISRDFSGNAVLLRLGEDLLVTVVGNRLQIGEFPLRRLSEEESIAPTYYCHTLKEDDSDERFCVKIYSENSVHYAELTFREVVYKLALNGENRHEIEYSNGHEFFWWNIPDSPPLANYHPVFYDGNRTYRFTVLSPSNIFYMAKEEANPIKSVDALYFTSQTGNSSVKLLSNDLPFSYDLKQVENSSEVATTYECNGATWSITNNRAVVFDANKGKYHYLDLIRF